MLDRIFIVLAIIIVLLLLFKLFRVGQLRTAQRTAASLTTPNSSQILYFSSAVCSQCSVQEKILNQICESAEFRDVMLKKYSVDEAPALAEQWGVKTLPTTILQSRSGTVKQVNNGLVSGAIMLSQLRELEIDNAAI